MQTASADEIEDAKGLVWAIFNADPSPPRRSATEFFSGRTRGKSGKLSLKPTSAQPSRRHTASETVRAQYSKPAIDPRYTGGRHFAIINSLPEQQIALLRAIYQPAGHQQFECSVQFARHLHDEYLKTIPRQMRMSTRLLIRRMVDARIAAARDWRLAIALRHRPQELFGVEDDTWRKYRADHWRAIGELFSQLHHEAVLTFYRQC